MIAELCDRFHWPPAFWRTMGIRELRAWIAQHNRHVDRRTRQHTTDPHSWDGREADGWWAEQDRKRREGR